MTPSAVAGPGVSRPIAATRDRSTFVTARMLSNAPARASTAIAGPSRTRLGTSTRPSTRKDPSCVSTVALLAVPPLSRPTTTQSCAVLMGPAPEGRTNVSGEHGTAPRTRAGPSIVWTVVVMVQQRQAHRTTSLPVRGVAAAALFVATLAQGTTGGFVYDAARYFAGSRALFTGAGAVTEGDLDFRGVLTTGVYAPAALADLVLKGAGP